MEQAKQVYQKIINMLDYRGWKYERHDEDLVIASGVAGEDLPIAFIFAVKPQNHLVQFLSKLPVTMPEEKRIDGAIAACAASNHLIDGSFDYDVMNGSIVFRLTSSYLNSDISEDLLEYMLMVSAATIDEYNDKFLMLAKGMITIQKFLEE